MADTQFISDTVKAVRAKAESAMSEFDRKGREIERIASRGADLFSASAQSYVVELVEKSRDACRELYVALQALVVYVDEKCRPEVNEDTPAFAVKEVLSCIEYLNSESKIKNNFTYTLNSSAKSDVAQIEFIPSLESSIIEKYWENLYENLPQVVEERLKEEERNQQKEKEKQQKEEEKRIRLEKMRVEYKTAIVRYSKEAQAIEEKRNEEITAEVEKVKQETLNNRKKEYTEQEHKLSIKLEAKQSELDKEKEYLDSLWGIALIQKSNSKKRIEILTSQLNDIQLQIAVNEKRFRDFESCIMNVIVKERKEITERVHKKYPLPKKPVQPDELRFASMTPTEIVYEKMKDAIYEYLLTQSRGRSINDIIGHCALLQDMSHDRVQNMLNVMKNQGKVKSSKGKNGYLYRAVESSDSL